MKKKIQIPVWCIVCIIVLLALLVSSDLYHQKMSAAYENQVKQTYLSLANYLEALENDIAHCLDETTESERKRMLPFLYLYTGLSMDCVGEMSQHISVYRDSQERYNYNIDLVCALDHFGTYLTNCINGDTPMIGNDAFDDYMAAVQTDIAYMKNNLNERLSIEADGDYISPEELPDSAEDCVDAYLDFLLDISQNCYDFLY